jgi:hypothetical protein
MLTPQFAAGTTITAASLASVAPLAGFKFADQNSGQSNTALVNDTDLFLTLAAGGVYLGDGMIIYSASTAADYQATFTVPAGATLAWSPYPYLGTGGSYVAIPSPLAAAATITADGQGTATSVVFPLQFSVVMGATAGNLQWQFAQNNSDASNLNTRAGSYLRAWKVA